MFYLFLFIGAVEIVFMCPKKCGKVYQTRSGLIMHLKYQCGKAPQFMCEVCLKKFKRPDSLKTHLGLVHHIVR